MANKMNQPRDIVALLRGSELFADLKAESVERIADRMKTEQYARDAIICREGDPGNQLYIIIHGDAVIQKDMGWGTRELDRMGAGEVFGEMALITRERRSATVKAIVDTECLQLDQNEFDSLVDQDSHFAQRVAQIVSRRLAVLGQESSKDLLSSYRTLMLALAGLAESRDPETGAHLERTRGYCTLLADLLSSRKDSREVIESAFIDGIHYVSPLHDIGKVATPDSILLKPGRLSSEEFETMKTHTSIGAKTIRRVLDESHQEVFHMAYNICLYHHERWDGTGYPEGIAEDEIPVEARIMSVADVFDAMLSKRVYKQAYSLDTVMEEMSRSAGTQFDPRMIKLLEEHVDRFASINQKYSDEE